MQLREMIAVWQLDTLQTAVLERHSDTEAMPLSAVASTEYHLRQSPNSRCCFAFLLRTV